MKKPKKYDFNLMVIGAGSGGLVASYLAGALKAKVALVEKDKMGGDCLNTGCVPSKALIRSAKILSYTKRAQDFGLKSLKAEFEFSEVMDRVRNIIEKIAPHDSVERYTSLGVDCLTGTARLISPYEVEVTQGQTKKVYTTKAIIIATGAKPFTPPLKGWDQVKPLTSDNIWKLRTQPRRLLVLGGGPIGCELAQCFQRLGSQVTLVELAPRIMIREDEDVSRLVSDKFLKEGLEILTNHRAQSFEVTSSGEKVLICESDGQEKRVPFDEALVALGRRARVSGFGLEELGVKLTERKTIAANDFLSTNFKNIFVCGDVTGPYQFTHTAAHQAYYACVNALFKPYTAIWPVVHLVKKVLGSISLLSLIHFLRRPFRFSTKTHTHPFKVDYSAIPWATYTDPEVATVGLTETTARKKGIVYDLTKYNIDDLDRAIADSEDYGCVKVLTEKGSDKILGATIVGQHAGDLIVEFITALKNNLGLNSILSTIHIYPTMAEANKFAAGQWRRARTPQKALSWLEKFHSSRRNRTLF